MSAAGLIAVVPVRHGIVPAGGAESVAEAGGRVIVVGSRADDAVLSLTGVATDVVVIDTALTDASGLATLVAAALERLGVTDSLVVPASPDGRDLAPHLAHRTGRPLFAGAVEVRAHRVRAARHGGLAIAEHTVHVPFVATLQPGQRGVEPDPRAGAPRVVAVDVAATTTAPSSAVTSIEVLPPDVSTMDLAEAPRIVGGGAGLDSAERFALLARVATALDASMGVTRVVTDRGWAPHERQIGTTGVVVDPTLYLAFGISGAVQHTSGLGQPTHVISVNTDAHCPMMQMADLAIVSDANAVLDHLAERLSVADRNVA